MPTHILILLLALRLQKRIRPARILIKTDLVLPGGQKPRRTVSGHRAVGAHTDPRAVLPGTERRALPREYRVEWGH